MCELVPGRAQGRDRLGLVVVWVYSTYNDMILPKCVYNSRQFVINLSYSTSCYVFYTSADISDASDGMYEGRLVW